MTHTEHSLVRIFVAAGLIFGLDASQRALADGGNVFAFRAVATHLCSAGYAGTWTGPDLAGNSDPSNASKWTLEGYAGWTQEFPGKILDKRTTVWGGGPWSCSAHAWRSVAVTPGKRYQYKLRARSVDNVEVEPAKLEWWTELKGGGSTSRSSSSSYKTKTITTILNRSSTKLWFHCKLSGDYPARATWPYVQFSGNATLKQVVYDPQMELSETDVRLNSDDPGGSTTSLTLGLNSLSFADEPTSWSVDWGDGAVESQPLLNANHEHVYEIPDGDSHSWMATLNGSNQAGSGSDSAMVTVLRQPDIALSLNGVSLADGDTFQLDVLNEQFFDVSLGDSAGFVEEVAFSIPGKLEERWSNLWYLDYLSNLFDEDDIGQSFPLTAQISNTGLGKNSDTVTINLAIVPEPVSVLLFVGLAAFIRRRG